MGTQGAELLFEAQRMLFLAEKSQSLEFQHFPVLKCSSSIEYEFRGSTGWSVFLSKTGNKTPDWKLLLH
jgi:hypothetical protein